MRRIPCLVLASAVLLGPVFLGCQETLPPEPTNPNPNGDQRLLVPPRGEPFVVIDTPAPPSNPTATVMLGSVIVFEWHSGAEIEPQFVRWLCMQIVDTAGNYDPTFDIVGDLNLHPGRYESRWSSWVPYTNPDGRTTTAGKDDPLSLSRSYIFAVQAKNRSGKVTTVFNRGVNIRQFVVSTTATPLLMITEPFIGSQEFLRMNPRPATVSFPAGLEATFSWKADASSYGGRVVGCRYGWDVSDINNDGDWAVAFSLQCTHASPIAFYSGVHTLLVEAIDNSGAITLGMIELTLVPFTMERDLLWVDDFRSTNDFQQYDYAFPREDEHDDFWLGLCGKAEGFDASRDVYDVSYSYGGVRPDLSLIGKYKNIIWTYNSDRLSGVWDDVILFTPESMVSWGTKLMNNYLSVFLAKGGHLITEGMSEKASGLAAILPPAQTTRGFPLNIKCELLGNLDDCDGDTSGVNSYAYKDYCVTVLDKIDGTFRLDADMPMRKIRNYDCMYPGAVKSTDVWHDRVPGMPDNLNLWSEILVAGRFYAPNEPSPRPGGFTPAEIYDPAYWMNNTATASQGCFHPMYRMKSKNTASALNNQPVALWVTKYADVYPDVTSGVAVAAPSAHFGFELWFFDRTQVNRIVDVIFGEWGIAATRDVPLYPAAD
jgi:hypothetical protein